MPKARAHGQGALYWMEARGLWRAVIDVGFDPETGKRLQKARMSRTKEDAMKKLNQMLRERATLGMVLNRSTRVRELAEVWLKDVADRARPHTISTYRSHVKRNILPILGDRIASDLSPADIRRMHAAMRRKGVSDATVSGAHRTLVSLLEHARAERIIADNIAALNPPRRTRPSKSRSSLTRDEARAVISLSDARWTLALFTGIRSGEARALRWSDIDLAKGVAQLSWSLTEGTFTHGCGGTCGRKQAGSCPQRQLVVAPDLDVIPLNGRHLLVRPKNGTAREIPLTASTVLQLQALSSTDDTPNPHGLVWHRADGSPKTNPDDNEDLQVALVRAGVDRPGATTHWLRHSYVTLSEHAGIPWAAFSGVSGHGSTEASDPYRHVLTSEGRRAVESLADWVGST